MSSTGVLTAYVHSWKIKILYWIVSWVKPRSIFQSERDELLKMTENNSSRSYDSFLSSYLFIHKSTYSSFIFLLLKTRLPSNILINWQKYVVTYSKRRTIIELQIFRSISSFVTVLWSQLNKDGSFFNVTSQTTGCLPPFRLPYKGSPWGVYYLTCLLGVL